MSEDTSTAACHSGDEVRAKVLCEDTVPPGSMAVERSLSEDGLLVHRLRQGDAEASYRFVHEYYPGIYRHLLYLTGRRETAEDLAQETFLQAWRRLETFDERGALRP